ncbi:hypothetical protein BU17DRAFT_70018 [Hysterangium stoloniferum]|nr:hypothetical protein BU17DRAFT_70018 [Hysterangium stoloniferum]
MCSTSLTDTGAGGRLHVPSRLALSAATTRAQIRAMDPAMRRDLFAEYIILQKHSKNLVFFDREFDEAREFPYPMSQGRVIYPEGIPAYLNMRHIKFECFCALLSPVLLEVKTIAGRTRAFCSDCGLNVIIDEKYVSANLAADYPTQDKDGGVLATVSPVSSTPYRHIPPRAPLHRRVLITTRKRSSLAYAASHPVVAAIALVPPGIQAASRSPLQRATGTHAVTQQHEAFKAHIADCRGHHLEGHTRMIKPKLVHHCPHPAPLEPDRSLTRFKYQTRKYSQLPYNTSLIRNGTSINCLAKARVSHVRTEAVRKRIVMKTDTFNEKNLSPCLVASALMVPCSNGNIDVGPISKGYVYVNPTPTSCGCSTVVYSLMAACAACQGVEPGITKWSEWIQNCSPSDILISQYSMPIPQNISIPSWAYVNVATLDEWDSSAAFYIHGLSVSDSAAVASATGTSGLPNTTSIASATATDGVSNTTEVATVTGVIASTGTVASAGALSKKSNHTGTIAGVVGGVVGLALIAVGVYILVMRRHNTTSPASRGDAEKFHFAASTSSSGFLPPTVATPTEPKRLYDPSDPSTFPDTYAPSLPHAPATGASDSVAAYNHPQNRLSSPASGKPSTHYNGVAEL